MSARDIALSVVRDVFPPPDSHARERGAQEALDYRSRKAKASTRDRAFATELAYGAIKLRRALDWHLAPLVGERASQLPPAIREILRLGVYELAYTEPDAHATVFEFVNLAKRYGHRGLGNLVNAVLRGFLREPSPLPDRASFASDDEFLGTRYSLPTWLVRQWCDAFGDRVEEICAAVNAPARVALTVNTLQRTREEIAAALRDAGVTTAPSPLAPDSLLVESGVPRSHEAEAGALWWLQSESSACVVALLDPKPGESVLDVCSGRGNKALQIAARLSGSGKLTCIERDARKAAILAQRMSDAGMDADIVVADAAERELPEAAFDRVLVDAPCSGTGVVGRHPEARWKKQGTDGERLAVTQRAILDRVARSVRTGGTITYAVCSTDPRETTDVMQWFLSRYAFDRLQVPAAFASFETQSGDVLIPPGIAGRDGFFIASAKRR